MPPETHKDDFECGTLGAMPPAGTDIPTVHASFTIERRLKAAPARVFAAFATPEGKSAWFAAPSDEWVALRREFDCRVGGREVLEGRWKTGVVTLFDATYHDVVPNRRLVYSYGMHVSARRISVSLATIEIRPDGEGSLLLVTEQGAFLDGYEDNGSREHGTRALIEQLAASVE